MSQHGCPERLSNRSKGFQDDGPTQPTMEVLVETLTGTAFEMTVLPTDTIFAIKSKIFRVEGIPVSQQHLLYNLKELDDASSLSEHSIGDGARLRLVLGMRGGPISTRRLPPPPSSEPWRDIERLLDGNRDDVEWGGGGCKVTVLVFRDGERVNMLRVKENNDGTYSPLDHKYSASTSSSSQLAEREVAGGGSLHDNAVTMGKMLELRQRMESLSLQRANAPPGDKAEIQKTRSEETLSVASLLDEVPSEPFKHRTYTPYSEAEDTFAPLYDGNYTRYDYDCSFTDRYTLLPPIGTRTDSDQSVRDAVAESERLKLSDALAGSILVKGRRETRDDEAAILEECLDGEELQPQLAAKNLAPIPAAEYSGAGVVGGGWRGGAVGAVGGAGGGLVAPHSHSASSLHVPLRLRHQHHQPPLSDALFSSSTSDLEKLKRNGRMLPALSRHRNREHLHLSDERLELAAPPAADRLAPAHDERTDQRGERTDQRGERTDQRGERTDQRGERTDQRGERTGELGEPVERTDRPQRTESDASKPQVRARCLVCRRRLGAATRHGCRCGGSFCAPHRYAEVHGCRYDYKADARRALARDNPRVAAAKLPDI